MSSSPLTSGSYVMKVAVLTLLLIGWSVPSLAADPSVTNPTNDAALNNTFPWAIDQVNADTQSENSINFSGVELNGQTLTVTEGNLLPNINLSDPAHTVSLNATEALTFEVNGPGGSGTNILHVESGKAIIKDLRISGGDFEIGANGILEFNDTEAYSDRTVTNIIKGAGKLIKAGSQTLVLGGDGGANTYTGGTEITGGILTGDRNGLAATTGTFNVGGDGTLIFEDNTASTTWNWDGETEGGGKIRKSGSSTLELTGNGFTHTGGTTIDAGTLEASSLKLGSSDVTVTGSGTLKFNETGNSSFASNITGSGAIAKTGLNELHFTGNNDFSGGLTVEEGTARGSADTLGTGTISLVNDSEVIFNQTATGTFSGGVAGTGTLRKEGVERLTIDGDLDAGVSTALDAGTLQLGGASLDSTITAGNNTTVIFQRSTDSTLAGDLNGTLTLVEKTGAGKLIFSGDKNYIAPTAINAGTLLLRGNLQGTTNTTVASGATLEVDGAVVRSLSGDLDVAGRLSTTQANSVLSVENNVVFQGGSSVQVAVTQGESAPIQSTGAMTGTLDSMIPTSTDTCDDCELLSSLGGIDGDVYAQWQTQWGQDGSTLKITDVRANLAGTLVTFDLVADPSAIGQAAQTRNQIATADALEYVFTEGSKDQTQNTPAYGVYEAINSLSSAGGTPALQAALNEVDPESLAAFTTARESNAQQFSHALWQRFRSSQYKPGWYGSKKNQASNSTPPVSAPASAPEKASHANRFAGWAQPFGIFASNDGRGKASDMESRVYGLFGGVDYALPESTGLKVGAALGYSRYSIFSESLSDMQGQANTYQAALYGAWQNRHFHVGVSGRYGYTNMRSQRTLTSFGSLTADARFSGQEYGGMIEIGATLGNPTFFAVRPVAAFRYDRFTQGSFKETGAEGLSLAVDRQDFNSLLTTLGARVSKLYTLDGGFGIEPEIRVGWTYQAGDKARPVTATFYNVAGATPFTTNGAESDRNSIWVGAGYVMRTTDNVRIGLDYDAYIGKYYTQQVVSAELQIIW